MSSPISRYSRRFFIRITLFLLLILPLAAVAGPEQRGLVYAVQSDEVTLYLTGSIHVLREDDYPLPAVLSEVYGKSDALIMEIDLDDLDPLESAALIRSLAMAPNGSDLRSLMGEASFNRSMESALALGIDLERFGEVRPWFAALMVLEWSLRKAGYSPENGVEQHFLRQAIADKKPIEGLETMEQQLNIFASLSDAEQGMFLEKTLAELDQLTDEIDKLLVAWKTGDDGVLESLLLDSFDEFPELFDELVDQRNQAWDRQLTEILRHGVKDYMVIVGALHLLGERGVIELLRQRGFEVRRL
ncbi:MAG: TraB/GumN family protein [Gammaproteobacteria bacterium]|nr:TraB/GumN family protein [Gammaproteobacteria bacterium]